MVVYTYTSLHSGCGGMWIAMREGSQGHSKTLSKENKKMKKECPAQSHEALNENKPSTIKI